MPLTSFDLFPVPVCLPTSCVPRSSIKEHDCISDLEDLEMILLSCVKGNYCLAFEQGQGEMKSSSRLPLHYIWKGQGHSYIQSSPVLPFPGIILLNSNLIESVLFAKHNLFINSIVL